jgi:hypothetical protein
VETDVQAPSEILSHERFAVETREPVEVYRVERNPLESEPAEQPQETAADDMPPNPPPGGAGPPSDSARLPHEEYEMEEREPVQVYRLERNPMKAEPARRPQGRAAVDANPGRISEVPNSFPDPVPFPERKAAGGVPVGRWEEFHEFHHPEPKRGRRLHLEPVPLRQGPSSGLLTADLEREHRSSFLTLVVPSIAVLVVVGALLWSGLLQYRVHQQNAAMNALQQQNQKLAESLSQMSGEQMSEEQKASGAPDSRADALQNPATTPPSATPSGGDSQAAAQSEKGRRQNRQSEKRQTKNRQGVAVPPPIQQRGTAPTQQKGSQYRRPVDAGYAPELVPPYPTNFQPGNVAVNAANSQPVPNAGVYHPPFTPGANQQTVPVAGSGGPATAATTAPRPSVPQASAPSRLPAAPPPEKTIAPAAPAATPESATQYQATGNGAYASPLAQNIETVEGLQRHSPVQLKEFHARAGASTKATPNVRLSVQQPDQARGSYAVVVDEGGSSYQLRGQVNHPLVFTDAATHREYALVVLSIANQQVYGYVRATQ